MKTEPRRLAWLGRLLQRESAEHYMFLTLLSFAASVSITRLFLTLTNYPQLGGGELHIAHVLWGGLLLYIAALLPLLFANRRVYTAGALFAGSGVGLFIDEIGKFITSRNDYFFPIAASLVYVLFLLTLAGLLHMRRLARSRARDGLARVFEDIWESLHHTLTPRQYAHLRQRLEVAAHSAPSERHANLVASLTAFLDADTVPAPVAEVGPKRSTRPVRRFVGRVASEKTLRLILMIGLLWIGLLTLKNPATVLLRDPLPAVAAFLDSLRLGRHVDPSTTPIWSSIRLGLEGVVGALLLASACLLAAKKKRLGGSLGYVGLLISLTTLDVLLFYFEQFSTIITTTIQLVLWIGVTIYRRRS